MILVLYRDFWYCIVILVLYRDLLLINVSIFSAGFTLQFECTGGWSEKFSASTIDGNNIGKIFYLPKLVHLS